MTLVICLTCDFSTHLGRINSPSSGGNNQFPLTTGKGVSWRCFLQGRLLIAPAHPRACGPDTRTRGRIVSCDETPQSCSQGGRDVVSVKMRWVEPHWFRNAISTFRTKCV